jgi:hypothetical protein
LLLEDLKQRQARVEIVPQQVAQIDQAGKRELGREQHRRSGRTLLG